MHALYKKIRKYKKAKMKIKTKRAISTPTFQGSQRLWNTLLDFFFPRKVQILSCVTCAKVRFL